MAGQVKLTIDQQIEWMKEKGVTFQYYKEEDAADFLRNNTYFFKLKAFQKDYIQNPKTGKYIGLDFAYLVELSTLDMHLRRLIPPCNAGYRAFPESPSAQPSER